MNEKNKTLEPRVEPDYAPGKGGLWAWRHPIPSDAEDRCVGRLDVLVDQRRVRRLARQIITTAKWAKLPHHVITSPLRRCVDVGRELKRRGWTHKIDERLIELDFGQWEGKNWLEIDRSEIDAWNNDFVEYAPGGGENLRQMLTRARAWQTDKPGVVIAHAGWMVARRWIDEHGDKMPEATQWPESPDYASRWRLD